jgi:1,4-dihydroxy-2-naphthoate polyprenyltransferase
VGKRQAWLHAFRLRTLPLALSSILTGSSIAYADNKANFSWVVFFLCILTTLFLQILSNLANDYGDSKKGTDNEDRIGPKRAVQLGLLSYEEIWTGIVVCSFLCLLSGVALIYEGTKDLDINYAIFFFVLGLAAIAAAVKYTVGKSAYGYLGLGDLFVLLFFGLVGVCGSHYLLAHKIHLSVALPAFTIGAFATGVLNLNNMRDHISDEKAGKITMVVRIGLTNAKRYHNLLIILGFVASIAFVILNFTSTMQFLFIITVPLFRRHLVAVKAIHEPVEFDPLLKQLAISTFIFSILFAVGMIVGSIG